MRAAREDAIAAAAYALLEQHGFAGTTMQAIARDAHASMETLYRWYGDKTGLYRTLIARNTAEVAQAIDTGPATGLPLLAQLGPILLTMLLGPRAIALNRAAAADATGTLGEALATGGRATLAPRLIAITQQALDNGTLSGGTAEDITDLWLTLLIGDLQTRRITGALPPLPADAIAARAHRAITILSRLYATPPAP